MEEATNKRNEVDILIDDALVLTLRRLTARTLCSCKCVSLLVPPHLQI
jgi:hypothetical protein